MLNSSIMCINNMLVPEFYTLDTFSSILRLARSHPQVLFLGPRIGTLVRVNKKPG